MAINSTYSNLKDQLAASLLDLAQIVKVLAADLTNLHIQQAKLKAKEKLSQLQLREEEDNRQCLKVEWPWQGDTNTLFSSRMIKERTLINSRLDNMDLQGHQMTTRGIEGVDFYTNLFKARDTSDGSRWFPRLVTNKMNMWLCRLPLEEEVSRVVVSLT